MTIGAARSARSSNSWMVASSAIGLNHDTTTDLMPEGSHGINFMPTPCFEGYQGKEIQSTVGCRDYLLSKVHKEASTKAVATVLG